jgi:hypothetical protein
MGLLDRLVGRNGERGEAQEPAQPSAELLTETSSGTSSPLDRTVPEYAPGHSPAPDLQQGARLYNPYQVPNGCALASTPHDDGNLT